MSGFFVLSVDIDDPAGWRSGRLGANAPERRDYFPRDTMHRLVRLLDGHAMSATWVVGESALLDGWASGGSDSGSDRWKRMLGAIAGMATRQEIALSPDTTDGMRVVWSAEFARRNGNPVRTLALPIDEDVDLTRYAAFGFSACRWSPSDTGPSPLLDDLFQRPIPMWRPSELECVGPILSVPVSMILGDIDSQRRPVPEAARIRRIRKAIARSADDGAILHLAFRLTELGRSQSLFRTVEDVLFHVAEARARGDIEVTTIQALRHAYDALSGAIAGGRAA